MGELSLASDLERRFFRASIQSFDPFVAALTTTDLTGIGSCGFLLGGPSISYTRSPSGVSSSTVAMDMRSASLTRTSLPVALSGMAVPYTSTAGHLDE